MNTASPGFSLVRRLARDERGSIVVLSALMMTALLGCGALAVDLGNAYAVKTQLQNAADAGSLAAGKLVLTSQSAARAAALDIVPKNVPASWGTVTNSGDVEFGTWTSSTKTFVVSATNIVTARGRPPCAGEA